MKNEVKGQKEIQVVVFKIDEEEFAVEILQVKEIVKIVPITPVPKTSPFVEGIVNLRGQILTVIDLAKRLNLKILPRTEKSRIIVVEIEDINIGMIVDEVVEVLRLPEEIIETHPELISSEFKHSFLKGVGKLEKRLLILIDATKLFSPEEIGDLKDAKER